MLWVLSIFPSHSASFSLVDLGNMGRILVFHCRVYRYLFWCASTNMVRRISKSLTREYIF